MKAEKQLKCDKYNIYYFINYLKERVDENLVINICEKNVYDSKTVEEIIGTNRIDYFSINDLNLNAFNIKNNKLIKKSIIYIRLKKDEINNKNLSKLKKIRNNAIALIVEFDFSEKEAKQIANSISNRCLFGNVNYENEKLRTNVALFGKVFEYDSKCENKDLKALAIIHTFNEEDVIEQTITYLLNQGVDIYISDNWSTDDTYNIVKKLKEQLEKENSNHRIYLDRYPEEKPTENVYNWTEQLKKTERLSETMNYDWFIHYDADEIRISPWKEQTLLNTIKYIDSLGYNAIDNTVIDFRITNDNINDETIFNKAGTYFEIGRRPGHFVQIKTWKKNTNVELSSSGGHQIQFDNRKVYPLKILLKHYPLRSIKQAERKIFKDRLPRMEKEKKEKGWHIQYDNIVGKEDFIYEKENLHIFDDETTNKYLIEMLTGCGIERN